MDKRSTGAAKQLCLPLEEFLHREAARRAPDREPRQIGSIVAECVKQERDNLVDFLPRTILDRRPNTGEMIAVVYVFERMSSETEHQETRSGSDTWIDF